MHECTEIRLWSCQRFTWSSTDHHIMELIHSFVLWPKVSCIPAPVVEYTACLDCLPPLSVPAFAKLSQLTSCPDVRSEQREEKLRSKKPTVIYLRVWTSCSYGYSDSSTVMNNVFQLWAIKCFHSGSLGLKCQTKGCLKSCYGRMENIRCPESPRHRVVAHTSLEDVMFDITHQPLLFSVMMLCVYVVVNSPPLVKNVSLPILQRIW